MRRVSFLLVGVQYIHDICILYTVYCIKYNVHYIQYILYTVLYTVYVVRVATNSSAPAGFVPAKFVTDLGGNKLVGRMATNSLGGWQQTHRHRPGLYRPSL